MRLDRFRLPKRAPAIAAFAALAIAGLAACGEDDDEQALTFRADGAKITGPGSAETGSAEITLTNDGKEDADLQLIRVEGDRSGQDVIKALGAAIDGAPFPDWFFGGGGAGTTPGGESQTVTQVLEPGTYWAFNTVTNRPPSAKNAASFEVTGEESEDELPETDATVTAIDYGYKTEGGLTAGENEITFENTGAQPHHIIASRLAQGATIEQAEKFLKANQPGQGPFAPGPSNSDNTSVLEGGTSQTVTLDLNEPGNYALYCFISDRQGGPPHALKGMVDEVEVK